LLRVEKAVNKPMANPLVKRVNHRSLGRLDLLAPIGKTMKAA
jgi:hypothetical protein